MAYLFFYAGDGNTVTHNLEHKVTTIGRHPQSLVLLTDNSVSGHHAVIRRDGSKFCIQDLGSSNGTRVNGAQIEEASLNDGDRVSFGNVQAVFYSDNPASVIKTQPIERPKNIAQPQPPPLPPQTVAPEKKDSGCYSIIGKCVVGLFLLGFVGNMLQTCSKNNAVSPSSDSVQAQATYAAVREFGQMANSLMATQFSSESERYRFAVSRASEIARMPNVDPEFLAFARSLIQMLAKLQETFQNFESEVQSVSNKTEVAAALGHLYGLQQTQNRGGGELAELIVRMGLAQDQQRELRAIVAKYDPIISRMQAEFVEVSKGGETVFKQLKMRYPQYDFDKL